MSNDDVHYFRKFFLEIKNNLFLFTIFILQMSLHVCEWWCGNEMWAFFHEVTLLI